MEIAGFGLMNNMDDFRLSSSRARTPQNFEDILRRAHSPVSSESETTNAVRRPGASIEIDKNDKLYQLCLELETFLVKNLLSSMRNTVQKTGLVDDSFAGKMYEDMLWDEYAKDFTKNASFGLAEQAYRQLRRI
jgi:flagellar protein FlgJ